MKRRFQQINMNGNWEYSVLSIIMGVVRTVFSPIYWIFSITTKGYFEETK